MAPGLPPVLRGCPCASDGSFIELTSSLGETLRFTIDNLRSIGLLESCSNGARPLMALVEVSCPTLSLVFHAESSEGEFATFFAQGGYAELVRRDTVKAGDIRYANVQGLASERAISGEFDFVPWPQTERGDVAFRGSFAVCAEEGDLVINPCRNLPQGDAGAP